LPTKVRESLKVDKKNLVFFMTDQQRADTLGLEVGKKFVTPTWNKLAQNSTQFTHVYDACPLCVPARTALATGINPLANGMILNDWEGKNAKNHCTLHEYLYENGYEVAHVGVNHIRVSPPLKESLPFALWRDEEDFVVQAKAKGLNVDKRPEQLDIVQEKNNGAYLATPYSNTETTIWPYDLQEFKDVWFTTQVVDFIKADHEKPFALFVCLWAPHPPLMVPRQYFDKFDSNDITLPPNTDIVLEQEPRQRRKGAAAQLGAHIPQGGWKEARKSYYALANLCDEQLHRILSALDEEKISDDTMVICTTDHGDQLGEHRMFQKMEMYEASVRVPAIFHIPGCPPHTYDENISHLDFLPTVLDLLDIEPKKTYEGVSLKNSIVKGVAPAKKDVFGVYCGNSGIGDMRRMIVQEHLKYVYDGQDSELFDLKQDPYELDNLFGKSEYREQGKAMHEALKVWALENGDDLISY
jgi:arylsulfatase A-like enzyme